MLDEDVAVVVTNVVVIAEVVIISVDSSVAVNGPSLTNGSTSVSWIVTGVDLMFAD